MNPSDCLAIHDGELRIDGLDGPLTIVRDRWGIPHIRAVSSHDAFFGQGFCMAQDRAWQIELIRHMAHGRASALLNHNLLGLDLQNRQLGFGRLAEAEWAHQSPAARKTLEAYAAGINAAIQTQPQPFEFRAIGHTMQPWSPIDSLAIIKLVNGGLQSASKLKFGRIAAALGPRGVMAAIADVPDGAALIVPSGACWTGNPHPFDTPIADTLAEAQDVAAVGGGSNCWVIHGSRTANGAPLVAGDPHLPMTLPGQWYVTHMECPEFTAAGPCNPGYPGPLFYGHNNHVAWTMTHAQGDRWDLYLERVRRSLGFPEYLYNGEWFAFERREETFAVRDGADQTRTIWSTRHGVVISGDPESDDEVVAARWGLSAPTHDVDAVLHVLHARTAADARAGFRQYDSVSGNFCFADVHGDIGYQYTGRIPKRPAWMTPVPGWDGAHEWTGDVPVDELPAEHNPASGYIVTANNRTTTPDYPHYLTYMASRFRADRLTELIEATPSFTVADMARLQSDVTSTGARELAVRFASASAAGEGARGLQRLFRGWDASLSRESAAALAYDAVCEALTDRTLRAYYRQVPGGANFTHYEERRILIDEVASQSETLLVDDASWDAAIAAALETAAVTLVETYGADPSAWRWDARHQVRWRHNLGRSPEFAGQLNLPPIGVGGDGTTPFATTSDFDGSVLAGVSYRQIFDLSNLNAAQICIPPGNVGQPSSPHYADNTERWRDVEYHPLYIEWDDINANAEATLTLSP